MAGYKALFVGEQKVRSVHWKSRDDAAKRIVEYGLSVVSIFEDEKGTGRFFDVSDKVADKIKSDYANLADNVKAFLLRAAKPKPTT